MNVAISWSYTSFHRYDSDLDKRVEILIEELCEAVPAQHDGSAGGTGYSGVGFPSDCSHYFIVPNIECGERIRAAIDAVLKSYDARYDAKLETYDA